MKRNLASVKFLGSLILVGSFIVLFYFIISPSGSEKQTFVATKNTNPVTRFPVRNQTKEPDFGPYMGEMQRRIRRNWNPPSASRQTRAVTKFKIARSGRLLSLSLQNSSGNPDYDDAALAAVRASEPFRPLPAKYEKNDIEVQFTFDYDVYAASRKTHHRYVDEKQRSRQTISNVITGENPELPASMIPDEMHVHTPLHFVGITGPKSGKDTVIVKVTDKSRPISLFLTSYNKSRWAIQAAPGVRISKVIVGGYEPQNISGLAPDVSVFNYSMQTSPGAYVSGRIRSKAEYHDLLEKISYLTGAKPATVQWDYYPESFVVDGYKTAKYPSINSKFDQHKVILHCSWCTLGPDGLSVSKGTAFATRAYTRGKRYFEAELAPIEGNAGAYHVTNVGISSGPDPMILYNFHRQGEGEYAYGALGPLSVNGHMQPVKTIDRAILKKGDIIGVAIDLDKHRLYYILNGSWVNGLPSDSTQGMPIQENLEYQAAFSTDRNTPDMINVNFGSKPFRYQLPNGYKPYTQ